jgi:DNA-binding GntR family transcriptional regulator
VVRVDLIGQTTAKATKIEQQRLVLSAADRVIRIACVRYHDGRPHAYEQIVMPLSAFPRFAQSDGKVPDILQLAKEGGLILGLARERVSTIQASKTVAAHLHVRERTRLYRLDRLISAADGTPIEWRLSFRTLAGR